MKRMCLQKSSANQGFTLVEILIVTAIIGMLASLAMPSLVQARANTQTALCISNLRMIDHAKPGYFLEYNLPDGEWVFIEDLVWAGYLKTMPVCPLGGSYDAGSDTVQPSCNVGGHSLPLGDLNFQDAPSAPLPAPAPTAPAGGGVGGGVGGGGG